MLSYSFSLSLSLSLALSLSQHTHTHTHTHIYTNYKFICRSGVSNSNVNFCRLFVSFLYIAGYFIIYNFKFKNNLVLLIIIIIIIIIIINKWISKSQPDNQT